MNLLLLGTSLLRIRVAFNLRYHQSDKTCVNLHCFVGVSPNCFQRLLVPRIILQTKLKHLDKTMTNIVRRHYFGRRMWCCSCFSTVGEGRKSQRSSGEQFFGPLEHFGNSFHGGSHKSKHESKIWVIETSLRTLEALFTILHWESPTRWNKVVMFKCTKNRWCLY